MTVAIDRSTSERDQELADFIVLTATVGLGLVTWISLSDTTTLSRWTMFSQFIPAAVFALAALTRHPRWGHCHVNIGRAA
jgi:hypothetical protein